MPNLGKISESWWPRWFYQTSLIYHCRWSSPQFNLHCFSLEYWRNLWKSKKFISSKPRNRIAWKYHWRHIIPNKIHRWFCYSSFGKVIHKIPQGTVDWYSLGNEFPSFPLSIFDIISNKKITHCFNLSTNISATCWPQAWKMCFLLHALQT